MITNNPTNLPCPCCNSLLWTDGKALWCQHGPCWSKVCAEGTQEPTMFESFNLLCIQHDLEREPPPIAETIEDEKDRKAWEKADYKNDLVKGELR